MTPDTTRAVFLSYRREETRHIAGRLADRLTNRLGSTQVFMDVDTVEPGADFAAAIAREVASCNVLIALIGPTWSKITDQRGRRRLDDPDDFVVLEIRAALEREIRVIPVLVDGAVMPDRYDLPEGLHGLTRRNAVRLDHETFRSDVATLLDTVERILLVLGQKPAQPSRDSAIDKEHHDQGTEDSNLGLQQAGQGDVAGARAGCQQASRDLVIEALSVLRNKPGVYFFPDFPTDNRLRLDRIRKVAKIPPREEVVVLIDLAFRPWSEALAFGVDGIYCRSVGNRVHIDYATMSHLGDPVILSRWWNSSIEIGDASIPLNSIGFDIQVLGSAIRTLQARLRGRAF